MGPISTESILHGYRNGIFPMADSRSSKEVFWVKPEERGIIPIGKLHISRSLKKYIKRYQFHTTINTCFKEVVQRCANRSTTWINSDLLSIYYELYQKGHAFSIEVWLNDFLVGGLCSYFGK